MTSKEEGVKGRGPATYSCLETAVKEGMKGEGQGREHGRPLHSLGTCSTLSTDCKTSFKVPVYSAAG